tara:strand:- start:819 stop:998 length:180 start_codon:yes stop_codon:yes gene_type:complete
MLEITSNSNLCLRIGASKDEIFPNFLKYSIEKNGSSDVKVTVIANKKYLLGVKSLKINI